jgi:hypothetical protein
MQRSRLLVMAAVLPFWSVLAIITENFLQSADFTFDVLCTSGTLISRLLNQPTNQPSGTCIWSKYLKAVHFKLRGLKQYSASMPMVSVFH